MATRFKFQIPESLKYETNEPKLDDFLSLEQQLRSLIGTTCRTNAEKYKILKKRDELLAKYRVKNTDVNAAKVFSGNCPDMCPEKERYMRDIQKNLHKYECDEFGVMIPGKTVKDYSRSAADQEEPLPHELRPINVLQLTMNYLISVIAENIPSTNSELAKWYDFLWSRTRSIRKDITQQMLVDCNAADLVEKCARLHIFVSFRLSQLEESEFSQKMNTENLSKAFQTLRHMYDDMARENRYCSNESEFRSYDMLLNLSDSNVHSQVLSYRPEVYSSLEVQLALELAAAFQSTNYVRFFRILKERASFLQACLCYRFFPAIRHAALNIVAQAYRVLPLDAIKKALGFHNLADVQNFLGAYGLETDTSDSSVELINSRQKVNQFNSQDIPPINETCKWIYEKMNGMSLSEVLCNLRNVCLPLKMEQPINSFDASDRYTNDPVLASLSHVFQKSMLKNAINHFVNFETNNIIHFAVSNHVYSIVSSTLKEKRLERIRNNLQSIWLKRVFYYWLIFTKKRREERERIEREELRLRNDIEARNFRKNHIRRKYIRNWLRYVQVCRARHRANFKNALINFEKRSVNHILNAAIDVLLTQIAHSFYAVAKKTADAQKAWLSQFTNRWIAIVRRNRRIKQIQPRTGVNSIRLLGVDTNRFNQSLMTTDELMRRVHEIEALKFRTKLLMKKYFHKWKECVDFRRQKRYIDSFFVKKTNGFSVNFFGGLQKRKAKSPRALNDEFDNEYEMFTTPMTNRFDANIFSTPLTDRNGNFDVLKNKRRRLYDYFDQNKFSPI